MRRWHGFALFLVASLVFLKGCARNAPLRPTAREDLFTLEYGDFQSQISMRGGSAPIVDLTMRQGIFTVLDGVGKKATRFTSYGDILSIVAASGSASFNAPTQISADGASSVYIADRLGRGGSQIFDLLSGTFVDWIVRKLSPGGENLGIIGQEGAGGTSFPKIFNLEVLPDSSLVVVASSGPTWLVNRFNRNGTLLSSLRISENALPLPGLLQIKTSRKNKISVNVDQLVPIAKGQDFQIYLKLDYYGEAFEGSSANVGVDMEIEYLGSWIFSIDGATGKYMESLEVFSPSRKGEIPELLGVSGERIFLISYLEGPGISWELTTMDLSGKTLSRYALKAPLDALAAPVLKLSPEGQVFGLSLGEKNASVFWWDLGIEGGRPR